MKCPYCNFEISSMLPKDLSEKDLRFCPNCGTNYRYHCPICDNKASNKKNMITIIGIGYPDPDEIRCPDCKSLFYVCEECGRLVEPYLKYCPDENCLGAKFPLKSPRLSSNNYDGTGFCDKFKIKLSVNEDKYKSKMKELYKNDCSELYSAKIIGGYLFVWHDTKIDILDIDNNFRRVKDSITILGAKKTNISQCMALLADNIIIASEDRFRWFNLEKELPIDEVKGKPIGLIAGHCGVAMWTENMGSYHLYTALCPKTNSKPHIKDVSFDSDKYQLMEKSNCLAMSDTALYWQGKYGNIYIYDFFTESLKEIPFDKGKVDYIWINSDKNSSKISVAFFYSGQFCICEDLEGRRDNKFDNTFNDSINGIYVYKKDEYSSDYAYILGSDKMRNGVGEFQAPNGEHVNSILCKEENGNSVLLSMFKNIQYENVFVNIFALRKDSSSSDTIYLSPSGMKIEPIEMLCFGENIFVLHKKGIIVIERIKDNSRPSDGNNIIENDTQYSVIEENQEELPTDIDFELNDDVEEFVEQVPIVQINKIVEIPNRTIEQKEFIENEKKPSLGFDFSNDEDDLPLENFDSSSIIICPHCQAELPKDGTKFCSECGKPIEQEDKLRDEKTKIEKLLAQLKK